MKSRRNGISKASRQNLDPSLFKLSGNNIPHVLWVFVLVSKYIYIDGSALNQQADILTRNVMVKILLSAER